MAAALFVEIVVTSWQRFGLGVIQATGTMLHQNILGLMIHFIALPAFALLLSGRSGKLLTAAAPMGILIDVLTTSRGALGFSLLGYVALFTLSGTRRWTSRKRNILMAGIAGLFVIVPISIASFEARFSEQAELMSSDYDERAAFEKSASLMLQENPFGQGANHYVIAANLGGFNHRAGVATTFGSEGANVHNVYYLVAAETGYFGLASFILMLLHPLTAAMLCGWDNRNDQRGDLLIGLGVALLTIYLHLFFEWVFVGLEVQYMFAMDVGLVAGLTLQLGYWRQPPSRATFVQAATAPIGASKANAIKDRAVGRPDSLIMWKS
jgi:hypothetical protein